jgi:chemotaxis protein CheX
MPAETSCAITNALIDSCVQSIANTFSSMVMMEVGIGDYIEKKNGNPLGCISGSIGISGTHTKTGQELRAQISLIFPESLGFKIYRSMMMMEESDPVQQEEVNDVVGELANMTAGGAKTIMSGKDFQLTISLPTIAVGRDHYLSSPSGSTLSIVIPITAQGDTFFVELSANVG